MTESKNQAKILTNHEHGNCTSKFLPFESFCFSCPKLDLKNECYLQATENLQIEDDDILILADDDVIFSNWTYSELKSVLQETNLHSVFSSEYGDYPSFHGLFPEQLMVVPEQFVCSGVYIGWAKHVIRYLKLVNTVSQELRFYQKLKSGRNLPFVENKDRNWRTLDWDDQTLAMYFVFNSYNAPAGLDVKKKLVFSMADFSRYFLESKADCKQSVYNFPDYCNGNFDEKTGVRIFPHAANRLLCWHYAFPDCSDMFKIDNLCRLSLETQHSNGLIKFPSGQYFAAHANNPQFKQTFHILNSVQKDVCGTGDIPWKSNGVFELPTPTSAIQSSVKYLSTDLK
eukprot:GHVP01052803.1.p1 GENE.GHVP01052803.1~~GHVP01052803.1.p1  ORF type:complete len:387 (+),score=49.40 GHVP01052803.1:136-1161(+)